MGTSNECDSTRRDATTFVTPPELLDLFDQNLSLAMQTIIDGGPTDSAQGLVAFNTDEAWDLAVSAAIRDAMLSIPPEVLLRFALQTQPETLQNAVSSITPDTLANLLFRNIGPDFVRQWLNSGTSQDDLIRALNLGLQSPGYVEAINSYEKLGYIDLSKLPVNTQIEVFFAPNSDTVAQEDDAEGFVLNNSPQSTQKAHDSILLRVGVRNIYIIRSCENAGNLYCSQETGVAIRMFYGVNNTISHGLCSFEQGRVRSVGSVLDVRKVCIR